ncbi:MAG TPA: HlyC/CorC family transporter [Candidatus Eisenbacteria bacterium]|uniref:HlyC/CorC family transporter n=1 Tax=Eiseniibacteriota bacterium TaxID=2212470 RepID=A0A7V2AWB6_UNCEI|nr:HlyC/CorC family transporter [Candidatus Eisenbacteria bacterium]
MTGVFGPMDREVAQVLRYLILFAVHFMISGGIASFVVISRVHEDRLFPRESWGCAIPRLLHRNRLHLFLALLALEAAVLVLITIDLFGDLSSYISGGGGGFLLGALAPFAVIVVLVLLVSIAGLGAATRSPRNFAYAVSYPFLPLYILFRPVTDLFLEAASKAFPDLPRAIASSFFLFPESEESGEGFIEENGSRLMHSIVEFGVKKVREVMVPRIDVFALDVHTPVEEARERVSEAGHSRVPVYDGSIDKIMGVLFVKDLLRISSDGAGDLGQLVREVQFVPEGKKIDDLLREFQLSKKHMAVVVDEYGGTSGIVTLEDILEEIVGEIRDEHDYETPLIERISPGSYAVAGRMNLDDLEEALGISLPTDEVDTLGGFLYNLVDRVPDEGEEIEYQGIRFRIHRLDGQRIAEVRVELPRDGREAE